MEYTLELIEELKEEYLLWAEDAICNRKILRFCYEADSWFWTDEKAIDVLLNKDFAGVYKLFMTNLEILSKPKPNE